MPREQAFDLIWCRRASCARLLFSATLCGGCLRRRPVCVQRGGAGPIVPLSLIGGAAHAAVDAGVAAARRYVAARLPVLALPDGASIAEFELGRRLGARTRPVPGSRYYGVNSAVFECVHVATRARVAVKLLYAIADEPAADVESHALRDRCVHMCVCVCVCVCVCACVCMCVCVCVFFAVSCSACIFLVCVFALNSKVHVRRYGGDFDLLLPGARIHAAGAHGCYPLASLHVTACLGVFATELTRDLAGRMEIDREFAAARTLGVVFPVMGQSLQSELGARRRRAGGGGGGGGAPLYTASAWAVRGLQMAKGLAHLHAHRVVHRDVKPDNVLTDGAAGGVGDDEDATLVVSDLGECLDMALHCEHGFETPAAHPRGGAAAYWSPEVAGAAVRTRGATIDYAKQVRVRACRCACVQSCLEPCRFAAPGCVGPRVHPLGHAVARPRRRALHARGRVHRAARHPRRAGRRWRRGDRPRAGPAAAGAGRPRVPRRRCRGTRGDAVRAAWH